MTLFQAKIDEIADRLGVSGMDDDEEDKRLTEDEKFAQEFFKISRLREDAIKFSGQESMQIDKRECSRSMPITAAKNKNKIMKIG